GCPFAVWQPGQARPVGDGRGGAGTSGALPVIDERAGHHLEVTRAALPELGSRFVGLTSAVRDVLLEILDVRSEVPLLLPDRGRRRLWQRYESFLRPSKIRTNRVWSVELALLRPRP